MYIRIIIIYNNYEECKEILVMCEECKQMFLVCIMKARSCFSNINVLLSNYSRDTSDDITTVSVEKYHEISIVLSSSMNGDDYQPLSSKMGRGLLHMKLSHVDLTEIPPF